MGGSGALHTIMSSWDYIGESYLMLFERGTGFTSKIQLKRSRGAQQRFPRQKVNCLKVLHLSTQLRTQMLQYFVFVARHLSLLLQVATSSAKDWKENPSLPKSEATRKAAWKHISHADLLLEEKKIILVSNKMKGIHKTLKKCCFHMKA